MRYVLRIYGSQYSYTNYDDNIYRMKEHDINKNDIDIEVFCDDYDDITNAFNENIEIFSGATFCVKDLEKDFIIVGGMMHIDDIVVIQKYFNQEK